MKLKLFRFLKLLIFYNIIGLYIFCSYVLAGSAIIPASENSGFKKTQISPDSFPLAETLTYAQSSAYAKSSDKIYVLTIKTSIVPILTDYLKDGISAALKDKAQAVIIKIDTPGGLVETMRDIVQLFLNSDIPVIAYVYPNGAHAASAGVFILYASDVAAMCSASNLGSAAPVEMNGKDIGDSMKSKVSNDLTAFLESVAKEKNRNYSVVKDFIGKSVSYDAKTALSMNIINIVSDDIPDLLKKIDGKIIVKNKLKFKINSKNPRIIEYNIPPLKKILFHISNPNILYILMTIGIWALIYELSSPGIGISGAAGALCLVIAFFGFQTLPVSVSGIILILLGIGFIVLEHFLPTHGIVGILGTISFILGSLILFNDDFLKISRSLIAAAGLFSFLLMTFIIGSLIKLKNKKPSVGREEIPGKTAVVKQTITKNKSGLVFFEGELWTALASPDCQNDILNEGTKVVILRIDGLKLIVSQIP